MKITRKERTEVQFGFCHCGCGGKTTLATMTSSKRGKIKGQPNKFLPNHQARTHGMRKTRTYRAWQAMRQRCNYPRTINWHIYGGRGIKVCERWDCFENFFQDMGECPPGLSFDRIDNNGNYEPSNCRWVDTITQNRNRRTNRMIEYKGQTKTLTEWAGIYGMSRGTLWRRFEAGMSVERAFTRPVTHNAYI